MAREKAKKQKIKVVRQHGTTSYPVGDFLIRIKNAALARNREVEIGSTKMIDNLANTLKKEGFLEEVKKEKGKLIIRLAYRKKEPAILNLKLVSRPGLRIYMRVDELEKKRGPSTYILSTPEGILTSKEAIKKRIGGEVIVEIW